jgi:microcompartment protein CcmK/EutM
MRLGKVIGTVVCTRKEPGLNGKTLLVVQPISATSQPIGTSIVAIDSVGSGVGETVIFVRGKESSFPLLPQVVPTDAGITGIVDYFHIEE